MDAGTRDRLVKLIDELANAVDCVRNPNPGKVTMRRLNRQEYRNTVRDLTGVDYEPAKGFPGDDVGYGFDNIGDVLSLPPLLMEKYLDAAEVISARPSTRRRLPSCSRSANHPRTSLASTRSRCEMAVPCSRPMARSRSCPSCHLPAISRSLSPLQRLKQAMNQRRCR